MEKRTVLEQSSAMHLQWKSIGKLYSTTLNIKEKQFIMLFWNKRNFFAFHETSVVYLRLFVLLQLPVTTQEHLSCHFIVSYHKVWYEKHAPFLKVLMIKPWFSALPLQKSQRGKAPAMHEHTWTVPHHTLDWTSQCSFLGGRYVSVSETQQIVSLSQESAFYSSIA